MTNDCVVLYRVNLRRMAQKFGAKMQDDTSFSQGVHLNLTQGIRKTKKIHEHCYLNHVSMLLCGPSLVVQHTRATVHAAALGHKGRNRQDHTLERIIQVKIQIS